jgi:hypothetical protein
MKNGTRLLPDRQYRSVCTAILVSLSLMIALCSPFFTRGAKAQLPPRPTPGIPPAPSLPGTPPAPNLPNLDVLRNPPTLAPAALPSIIPLGVQPICDVDCNPCPECEPPSPHDQNYETPRTRPPNRTGEPGITLGSRNYNWSLPLVSLPGRSGLDLELMLTYNSRGKRPN